MIGIVLPTIKGREHLLEQSVDAWQEQEVENHDVAIYIVHDKSSIGMGWQAGAEYALKDGAEFLCLTGDDLIPHEGALAAGIHEAMMNMLPSPLIFEHGKVLSCGSLGGGMHLPRIRDHAPCATSQIPLFHASMWEVVGPIPDIHYYASDYVSWMLRDTFKRRLCWTSVKYAFDHLEGTVGRARHVARSGQDRATFLDLYSRGRPAR